MALVLIGLGGAAGSIARYLVGGWVTSAVGGSLPLGTLVVNLSGTFILGVLYAASAERAILPPEIRAPLMIGFLGAYTTFSTLALETWRLGEGGAVAAALANLGGSALLGIVAVWAGLIVGRAL